MQQSIWQQLMFRYRYGGNYVKLVYWNVALFLLMEIGSLVAFLFKTKPEYQMFVADWFFASSDGIWMLTKPWTAITYMFLHAGFFHILFNMIMLWFSGNMFESLLNGKRLMTVYLLGGLAALAFHSLSINVFPVYANAGDSIIVGASGSVSAVFMAVAAYAPQMQVALYGIFRVRLMWIAAFYILMELLRVESNDGVAHFAHLGGAFFGYVYILLMKKGNDLMKPTYAFFSFFERTFSPSRKAKMRVVKDDRKTRKQAQSSSRPTQANFDTLPAEEKQKVIDGILDKISKKGYDALSAKEKEILFKASNDR